jgi:hypothetical protein
MEQSASSEAESGSKNSMETGVSLPCSHEAAAIGPVSSQINPDETHLPYFFKIVIHYLSIYAYVSLKIFRPKLRIRLSLLPCVLQDVPISSTLI